MKISNETKGSRNIRDSVKSSVKIDDSDYGLNGIYQCTGAEFDDNARIDIGEAHDIGVPCDKLSPIVSFPKRVSQRFQTKQKTPDDALTSSEALLIILNIDYKL